MNKINNVSSINSISFKASRINLVSVADTHGDVLKIPQLMKTIQRNKRDLFEKSTEKATLNLLAIAGDFFMNPLKRGLLTNPTFCNGDVQYNFLSHLIYVTKMAAGIKNNFETIFALGNHDFDGGDRWIFQKLQRANMTTVMSNLDRSESPLPSSLMYEYPEKFVRSKVFEVPDSTDADKTNKVLVLGVTIPTMGYYNPNVMEATYFYNNSNKNDAQLEEKDLRKTIRVIKNQVKEFKDKYQKGAIIVLAHTGNKISSLLAKKIPEINLILNGHDHKEFETLVGSTLILSHGQSANFLRGTNIKIEDDGSISIQSRKFETEKNEQIARKDQKLQLCVNANLVRDLIPLVKFKNVGATPEELVLDDSIRYTNNVLANFLTSSMKEVVDKRIEGGIDVLGIPASVLRNGLYSNPKRTTFNNMDLIKMFDGINEDAAELKLGKISGEDLFNLCLENVSNNLKSRTRNTLIQWSDIQVNRTLLKSIKSGKADESLLPEVVKIRNKESGKFERINRENTYKVLLPEKYIAKSTEIIKYPAKIKHKFTSTGLNYDLLFRLYLETNRFDVKVKSIHREDRVL